MKVKVNFFEKVCVLGFFQLLFGCGEHPDAKKKTKELKSFELVARINELEEVDRGLAMKIILENNVDTLKLNLFEKFFKVVKADEKKRKEVLKSLGVNDEKISVDMVLKDLSINELEELFSKTGIDFKKFVRKEDLIELIKKNAPNFSVQEKGVIENILQ